MDFGLVTARYTLHAYILQEAIQAIRERGEKAFVAFLDANVSRGKLHAIVSQLEIKSIYLLKSTPLYVGPGW